MRKSDLPLGTLAIYDPETLTYEGWVKLLCGDILSKPSSWGFNKFFPLMTHENFIYVIMMTITEVNREVKQGKQEEFNKLVQKQKKKEEQVNARN